MGFDARVCFNQEYAWIPLLLRRSTHDSKDERKSRRFHIPYLHRRRLDRNGPVQQAASGADTAAKLASIAQHAFEFRVAFVLDLVSCFCAVVLAVTLYSITRDQDPDIAMLALTCRVAEGVIGAVFLSGTLGKLWLVTAAGANAPDPAAASALGAVLLTLPSWSSNLAATFFAVGSTLFSSLLLRGRIVRPVPLAWLGVLSSILAVLLLALVAVRTSAAR